MENLVEKKCKECENCGKKENQNNGTVFYSRNDESDAVFDTNSYGFLCERCYDEFYNEMTIECVICDERFIETNNPKENLEGYALSTETVKNAYGFDETKHKEGLYKVNDYPVWHAAMFSEARFDMDNLELIKKMKVKNEGEVCPDCLKKHIK
jgi:hypothetical protein